MSLYLKYRPKSLQDMVGQRHVIDILLAQAQQGKFSSSYMLYGPRGTGKTSTARLLAKLVNVSTKDGDGNPDLLNDSSAKLIDEGKTLDFVEIDAASHTGVDNIREEIIDKALYPPTALKMKVYVIDEVHMLSKGAFNALLKIMEEPKPYVMFILATTEINKVPDTIISRCQVFNFKNLTVAEIAGHLEKIAGKEGIEYEVEALQLIARLSSGAMRDAIKYLEQVSILGKITQENVAKFLGVVSGAVLERFIKSIQAADFGSIATQLTELVDGGTDLHTFVKDMLAYCDEHFIEDAEFYAPVTGMLQEIAGAMKQYPQPVVLWKRKLYLYCKEFGSGASPISQEIPQEKQITNVEPALPKEQVVSELTPEKLEENQPGGYAGTPSEFLQELIAKVDKIMIKSVLKQQTIVEGIDGNIVKLVIINEQFYQTIQKQETLVYLQDLAGGIMGGEVVIQAQYKTKEQFMSESLL